MKLVRIIFFLFALLSFFEGKAQLTTQKKIVSRLKTSGIKTVDLKNNGILLVSNFDRDSLSFNSQADFFKKRGTYLIRLNNNFDTVWTKVIYNLYTSDCLLNKDGKIVLVGKNYSLVGSQLKCGLNLTKLDINGTIIKSTQIIADCNFNNNTYYYETGFESTYINEYKDNSYIVFNGSFFKFNDNFDLIAKKTDPILGNTILPSYTFNSGNGLFKLNDSTLVTSGYSSIAFPASGFAANNVILVFDTLLNIKNYFKVNNELSFITSIAVAHNKLYIGGIMNDPMGMGLGFSLSFLTVINFNNFSSNPKKPIVKFAPNYVRKLATAGFFNTVVKCNNNKVYVLSDNNFSIVNDSLGLNNRKYLYCFDSSLNLVWNKRLHLFNTLDTLALDDFNNSSSILDARKSNEFLFKESNIVLTNYDDQASVFATSYFNRSNFGFNLSKVDTNGNNALCNATYFDLYKAADSLGFQNLPIPTFNSSSNPIFNANSLNVESFPPQKVTQKCLPLLPPKSKFRISNLAPGEVTCINSEVFIDEYSYNEPKTWQWIFPPQVNVSTLDSLYLPYVRTIKFTQAGVYPIKLVTKNDAGTDTLTQYVTVINFIPQPNLGNDSTICNGDTLTIVYQDPPNSLHYFTGPNIFTESDTLKITESGEYVIAAYTACGYLYDTINVNVASRPTANFSFTNTCNSLNVVFTDESLLNFNPSLAYTYAYKPAPAPATAYTNFSTVPNNNFNFPAYDSFDVRLIVRSALSCVTSDTITKRIVLKAKPTASFSYTNNCGSLQATLASTASITAGSIVTQEYYAGNSLIGTGSNFAYNFTSYGSYPVKHVVKSNFGCVSDTATQAVVIKAKPVLSLIAARDSVCVNTNYTIIANASVNASSITNYTWVKNNVLQPTILNVFADNSPVGTFAYKAIATAANGCKSDTATKIITVASKPTVTLTASNNCGSKQINMIASANVVNDNISNYFINYGDGNSAIINPNATTYTYTNYGTYNLKYVVKGSVGCASDTVYQTVLVKDKPTLSIGHSNNACSNKNFTLTANGAVNASTVTNYTWLRNGAVLANSGNQLTENQPAGTYTYKAVATSNTGCKSDTAVQIVTVENYPTTIFTAANGCVNKNILVTNASINNNPQAPITYSWTTSDGQTSNAILPNFSFATSGTKSIQLKTNTTNNCADSVSTTISIEDFPIADFAITEACLGKRLAIVNNSTGAITNSSWTASNGLADNNSLPNFTFNNVGNYSIKLQVTTANGCAADITKSTSIQAVQLFTSPMVDTSVVVGQPVQLGVAGALNYVWTPNNNLQAANSNAPIFTANSPGVYPLQVEGTTAQGCKGTANIKVKVFTANNYIWIPNAFTPNADGLNDRIRLTCTGLKSLSNFTIYNRFGQIVYTQNTCDGKGWDGSFKGVMQPTGAYVYTWTGIDFKGKAVSNKGTVLLVN
jgi:gliding motility-associated-like protein